MYQVNFSDQAMSELAKIPTLLQMEVVEAFTSLTPELLNTGRSDLGKVTRGGLTYHRLRVGEFRIYFESTDISLIAHYILHRHTYTDFAFRSHLPVSEDEANIEKNSGFWKFIDNPK